MLSPPPIGDNADPPPFAPTGLFDRDPAYEEWLDDVRRSEADDLIFEAEEYEPQHGLSMRPSGAVARRTKHV